MGHYLNVFKTGLTAKAEKTREQIYESALTLFREEGFEKTSMRDIAARAEVALGAAYYYFPSKEAIIQAYYERVQAEHNRLAAEAFANPRLSLRQRLGFAIHCKLDILQRDRRLLGVIFRYTGEPDHPLSCLGTATAKVRRESIAVFSNALEPERLASDLHQLVTIALWAFHMGVLILFLYDRSAQQRRTRNLVDAALDLTLRMLTLARNPLLKPIRKKVLALLQEAELIPELRPQTAASGGARE